MGTHTSRLSRPMLLAMFAVFGVAAIGLILNLAFGDSSAPAPFVLAWVAILGWNAYWFLWRVALKLSLADGIVEWETVLRRGHFPVSAITSIGPWFGVTQIRHTTGPSLLVLREAGWDGFLEEVEQAHNVDPGAQRGSGRSMFQ